MSKPLLVVDVRAANDVVSARQRARTIAAQMGFSNQDQIRIATSVSEIARNAVHYAGGGQVHFSLETVNVPALVMRVSDKGPGIPHLDDVLNGRYQSPTGMGIGITGTQRLMDGFRIESAADSGTHVEFLKHLPAATLPLSDDLIARVSSALASTMPADSQDELQQQNRDLLSSLAILRERENELVRLNQELEDTNRGVVALYSELDERAIHLKRTSEVKSRFLSNMSHEFRTPLNSIIALSRLLIDQLDGPLNEEQQKQVGFIRKSALGLSELVNDLLDLAKVEAGKTTVSASTFALNDLFGALRGMLKPLIATPGPVALVFEDPIDIPKIHTDEGKIAQIVRNFIANALKFTDRGEVRVSASMPDAHRVAISVADTGIGIAPADQPRLFEDFTQIDHARQKQIKGTGLGLSLSRKLADLLGGCLRMSSTVGVGSVFTVEIPIHYGAGGSESQTWKAIVDPQRRPVLVIEQDEQLVKMYDHFLRGSQYQNILARSLNAASAAIDHVHPVAVIIDIDIDSEAGWEWVRAFKAQPTTRNIPVFALAMMDERERSVAAGADEFSTKPLDRHWLMGNLDVYCQRIQTDVLIVTADETTRYLLRSYMLDSMHVHEANTADSALTMARALVPAVVLLDMAMDDDQAFAFREALMDDPVISRIPVIALARSALNDRERERLTGCAAILDQNHTTDPRADLVAALGKLGLWSEGTKNA